MTGPAPRIRWEDAQRLSSRPGTIAGYTGTFARPAFMLYGPERTARGWLLSVRLAPETEFIPGAGPGELKAEAERWLVKYVAALGAAFDLASTYPQEVSACRFCNALLRQSQDGLYADIDLNEVRNPEPWQCSGRYVASPGGRHKPMLESGTASQGRTGDGEPQ